MGSSHDSIAGLARKANVNEENSGDSLLYFEVVAALTLLHQGAHLLARLP
jgi:hypothetical protein